MALPTALQHGATVSHGCIGNRVYTNLSEDEMYFVVRGSDLGVVVDALALIGTANALTEYAKDRGDDFRPCSREYAPLAPQAVHA